MDDMTRVAGEGMPAGGAVPGQVQVLRSPEDRPLHERLRRGSELHNAVLRRLMEMDQRSEQHLAQRHDDWRRADEALRVYQDLSGKARRGDKTTETQEREMPWGRSIVIPTTYAMLWSLVYQETALQTARDPIIHFQGRSPEDVRKAWLMEGVARWDLEQSGDLLVIYQTVFDRHRYGFSVLHDTWEEEVGRIMLPPPSLPPAMIAAMPSYVREVLMQPRQGWGVRKEFNRWQVLDVYMWRPDPAVPLAQLQHGRHCGHVAYQYRFELEGTSREALGEQGVYFNLDAIEAEGRDGDESGRHSTGLLDTAGAVEADERPLRVRTQYVRLVPRQWGLSGGAHPELWQFGWVGGTIIRAHQCEYLHDEFPYSVSQSNLDLHATFTPGAAEMLDGLSRTINFLYNAHILTEMSSLYSSLVFDPLLVEAGDIERRGPGRNIRLTDEGHELVRAGHPIANALFQLQVQDVTAGNLGTASNLFQMAQRMLAATDIAQGQPLPDRRTLGEVQAVMSGSSQRLTMDAKLADYQQIRPAAYRLAANRQQFTSQRNWYRITGSLAKRLGADRMEIGPEDIYGQYDYIPHTPLAAPDPARSAEMWVQLLQSIGSTPALQQPREDGRRLNPFAILDQVFQVMGVNYLDQFYTEVQVQPDEQVQAQAQAGNLLPMPGARGGLPMLRVPAGVQG